MLRNPGAKTTNKYWNNELGKPIRLGLPSRFNASIWDTQSLIKKYASPEINYIEIGCAPGKLLAWTAHKFNAKVTGIDYSENGMASTQELFNMLDLSADLRCENLLENSLPKESFDLVTSFGLIEHFDDPSVIITKHIEMVKPGGVVLITIPNYGGVYGSIQKKLDPENLKIHNLQIMHPKKLLAAVDQKNDIECRAFVFGRPSLWILSLNKIMPSALARSISLCVSFLGLVLPAVHWLSPLIVLEIRKN